MEREIKNRDSLFSFFVRSPCMKFALYDQIISNIYSCFLMSIKTFDNSPHSSANFFARIGILYTCSGPEIQILLTLYNNQSIHMDDLFFYSYIYVKLFFSFHYCLSLPVNIYITFAHASK